MIEITDKRNCVGCQACGQKCPVACISFTRDEQGFIYPKADAEICIDCGLCEKVCPVLHQGESRNPVQTLAAWSRDRDVVRNSSSGGTFRMLASQVLARKGIVIGASFNNKWEVEHTVCEDLQSLEKLQKSKYMQSRIGDTYRQTEKFLKEGREVMFVGTPCQIAGLNLFLNHDYGELLLKVSLACHGAPSPGVWINYLATLLKDKNVSPQESSSKEIFEEISSVITNVDFRSKQEGWERYYIKINTTNRGEMCHPFYRNLYMLSFLKDLTIRPSCFACPVKAGRAGEDVLIADFWGIREVDADMYNKEGVSLILNYTGIELPKGIESKAEDYEAAVKHNSAIVRSVTQPDEYATFWCNYNTSGILAAAPIIDKIKGVSTGSRMLKSIRGEYRHLSPYGLALKTI